MFCGKCGASLENGTQFCPKCGEQIDSEIINNNRKKIKVPKFIKIIIPIIAALAVMIAVAFNINSGSSYENVIDNYFKAIETHNISLMKSILADYWLDYQTADYDTEEYLLEDLEDLINDEIDDYDCGENIKITYTITSEKEATEDDLSALKDNIYDWYAYYVTSEDEFNKSIKDACVLSVRFKVIGDEGAEGFTTKFLVVKESGKWKIALGGLDNSFYSNY